MDTPVVTIELVGEENYRTDFACRRAVDCRLPVADFIQYLLGEKERALAGWLECETLSKSPPILKTAAKGQEGKQTDSSNFLGD